MADEAAPAPTPAPAIEPGASAQSIAASITDRLRQDGAPGDGASQNTPADAGGTAPQETAATGDERGEGDRAEETLPPIAPPRSWSKEYHARWSGLDRETQEYLAQRDSEDSAAVRRGQNEAAEARKKAEADSASIAAERTQTAQQLAFLSQHIQAFDPILAEGAKTDWARLAQDNPGDYVARRAQFDQRVATVRAIEAERQRLNNEALGTAKAKMVETLRRDLNMHDDKEWSAFDRELTGYLVQAGFKPEFVAQVVDPVSVHIAHKAMKYDKLMAERAALEAKKKAPAPTKVIRAGALQDGAGSDARFEAAKKAALKSGNARTVASLIAQRLRATPQS